MLFEEEEDEKKAIDHYYSEQQEHMVQTMMIEQQMELEQLIQIAENLKNDIIQLHNQEQELIQRLKSIKASRKSLFSNLYSLISNKNLLFFGKKDGKVSIRLEKWFFSNLVSGFLTGICIVPAISKLLSSTRVS